MSHRIELTEEGLAALERLLEEELRSSLVELRRTDNIDFKEHVRHQVQVLQDLLHSVQSAQPAI